jgi:hypothetical protein
MQELANLKQQKVKSTTKLTEFKREHEQAKEAVEMLLVEDKSFERTVRKDLEKDEEHFEILYKLFKKRSRVTQSEKVTSLSESSNDPYGEIETANQRTYSEAGIQKYTIFFLTFQCWILLKSQKELMKLPGPKCCSGANRKLRKRMKY